MKNSKETKLTIKPSDRIVTVEEGKSLLEVLRNEGITIPASCGGKGRCGKCKVRLLKGHASTKLSATESHLLNEREKSQGYRLACQFMIYEDTEVVLPVIEKTDSIRSVSLSSEMTTVVHPAVNKRVFDIAEPAIRDQRSDTRRLIEGISVSDVIIRRLELLRRIPSFLREHRFAGVAILYKNELIDLRGPSDSTHMLGVAIDIGTTTIAMYLLDLEAARVLEAVSSHNPQATDGQDVISRIEYATNSPEGLEHLSGVVVRELSILAEDVLTRAGVSKEQVYDVSVVGNTAMIHLLLGITPEHIAASPFVPATTEEMVLEPSEVGLQESFPNAKIYIMQGVSAYIGSDIVAGTLTTRLEEEKGNVLLVDMGTNGEIILKTHSVILACSTAAGPAFEGGHISEGMIAERGAIDHVWLDKTGKISFSTILDSIPTGVCGSGLIDTVAVLLEQGILDNSGRLSEELFALRNSLGEVTITQRDVREVQLAKSSIRAGIEVLLLEAGINAEDLSRIFLAGAFGTYIDAACATRIGLLPDIAPDRIMPVGNAAGEGACISVINHNKRTEARKLSQKIEYIELSGRKDFSDSFVEFMMFPKE